MFKRQSADRWPKAVGPNGWYTSAEFGHLYHQTPNRPMGYVARGRSGSRTKCLISEHYLASRPLSGGNQRQYRFIQLRIGKVAQTDMLVEGPMFDVL